jgi:poly(3-hydroxybutyrate) depolymerase
MFDSVRIACFAVLGAVKVSANVLPAFNVDPDSISVSGLSGGGSMAAQLGLAYSDIFNAGIGVFAGGPYDCARNQYACALAFLQD